MMFLSKFLMAVRSLSLVTQNPCTSQNRNERKVRSLISSSKHQARVRVRVRVLSKIDVIFHSILHADHTEVSCNNEKGKSDCANEQRRKVDQQHFRVSDTFSPHGSICDGSSKTDICIFLFTTINSSWKTKTLSLTHQWCQDDSLNSSNSYRCLSSPGSGLLSIYSKSIETFNQIENGKYKKSRRIIHVESV